MQALSLLLNLAPNFYPNNGMSDPKAMASSSTPALLSVPSVVRYLLTLPRELVHKIIDNLCVSQVLSLSLHNVPYIEECILGHFDYKHLFQKSAQLRTASEYYRIYAVVLYPLAISPHKHTTMLATYPTWSKVTYGELTTTLHTQVVSLIDRVTPGATDLAVLSALSPTPLHAVWDSSTLELLKSRWTLLNEATKTLNTKKSEQLLKLRALVLEHPKILRAGLNGQGYKSNLIHTAAFLEKQAKELLRPKRGLGMKRSYTFKRGLLVLPHDRYLRLFLKVLQRYPLPDGDMPGITPPGGKTPTDKGIRTRFLGIRKTPAETGARLNHQYTPEAIENIRRAILGLTYSYTSNSASLVPPGLTWPIPSPANAPDPKTANKGDISMTFGSHTSHKINEEEETTAPTPNPLNLRTKQTPYSEYPYNKSYGLSQPCFVFPNRAEAYAALPEMEIQWLESFLWSCEYMANMRDTVWSEGMSVGEMWFKKSQYA